MSTAMSFTTSCFIRKNTPELRRKLEELGYHLIGLKGRTIITDRSTGNAHIGDYHSLKSSGRIDCDTSILLFLALAALRNDSDYMQWFTYVDEERGFHQCTETYMDVREKRGGCWHKASAQELIAHFGNKNEKE